jgi:hypothetical protein
LDVAVVHPLADNYQVSPGKKLELDEVDFSIAPFETVISLNNKPNKVHAVAIFALLQEGPTSKVFLDELQNRFSGQGFDGAVHVHTRLVIHLGLQFGLINLEAKVIFYSGAYSKKLDHLTKYDSFLCLKTWLAF